MNHVRWFKESLQIPTFANRVLATLSNQLFSFNLLRGYIYATTSY
jgi:hypothetical protein